MAENWLFIFTGVVTCIAVQLLTISIFNFASSRRSEKLLGIICLLVAIGYFEYIAWDFISSNKILVFIFGGKKDILYPPILFLYIKALHAQRIPYKQHLLLPFCYIIFFYIYQFYFNEFYRNNHGYFQTANIIFSVLYFSFYFYLGALELKRQLHKKISAKALKKYKLFFYAFNSYKIANGVFTLLPLLLYRFFPETTMAVFPKLLLGIGNLSVVPACLLLFFVISETQFIRRFFLKNNIKTHRQLYTDLEVIEKKVEQLISGKRIYTNPDLDLPLMAQQLELSPKVLSEYFREAKGISFNKYINDYRLKEFKRLVQHNDKSRYSIDGLAQLSGFNSRATFYRLFKKHQGMTPNQYIEKQQS